MYQGSRKTENARLKLRQSFASVANHARRVAKNSMGDKEITRPQWVVEAIKLKGNRRRLAYERREKEALKLKEEVNQLSPESQILTSQRGTCIFATESMSRLPHVTTTCVSLILSSQFTILISLRHASNLKSEWQY